jgi:ribonuclease BN (tRNA processing enzyme)
LNVKWEHEEGLDERIQDFIRNAAVVIMDSQYTAEEYSRHAGWGHSCVDDTVEAAIRANVRHLYLFHHDPDRADDQVDAMLDHARHMVSAHFSSLTVEAAREGVSLELTPASQTVMA